MFSQGWGLTLTCANRSTLLDPSRWSGMVFSRWLAVRRAYPSSPPRRPIRGAGPCHRHRAEANPRSLFRLRLFRFHQAVSAKPPEDETKHRRLQSRVPSAVPSVHQHHLTEQTRPRHTRRTLPVQEVFKPPLSHFWPLTFKFSAFNHLQAEMAPVLAKLGRQCGSSRPPRARARPPSSRWPW